MSSAGLQRNNRRRNFQVFYNKKRPEIARKYPFLGAKQIQRKVEELWRRLDPKEKEKFCVASPVGVGNLRRQLGEAWQAEEPVQDDGTLSPSYRTGELVGLSGGSYGTPRTADDVVPTSDDDEAQQLEMDEHQIFTKSCTGKTGIRLAENVLTSNMTRKKKLFSLPSLSSEADSDDNHQYVPRTTRNRTHSTMRSRGLLTLHMARMQMVATTSEGIGQVEFTRTSNSESEGISCDSWFDQNVLTEQLPDNKHSHTDEDTETFNILTTLSENKSKTPPLKMKMSAKDFDIENSSLKGKMAEEESTRDEVNNVESNEDEEEYTLSQESKRAITQYLSCSGLNGTFNTSTSDDENQDGETKLLIESAIDSLESDLLGDTKILGTDENWQRKVSIDNPLSVHERVGSILSEIINDVLNTDTKIPIYSKATECGLHGGKENVRGHDYDAGDDGSRPAHLTDRSLQTSDENRDSGSELWDRLFMRKTRRYTRKRSFSCSESEELSAVEMGMVGHPEAWEETGYETTDMEDTSSKMHTAHSSDAENTYRAQQHARQDTSAPSPEYKFIPSTVLDKEQIELKAEENKSIDDGAFSGTDHAHQFTPSPSPREQCNVLSIDEEPATSSSPDHMAQEGKHSTSGKVSMDLLKEKPNVHLVPASLHGPPECQVSDKEPKVTKNPSNNTVSTKYKTQVIKRGTPRPARNTMVTLLTRDYNMTTRAQSAAGKRNTRSRVLDYRLSGLPDKEQKTPSKTHWQRTDSKDSILSCDSGRSVRAPRQRGKKRKRHQSTSSVGSDFSTTSSVPESLEDDQWADIPTEGNELKKDQNTENEVRDSMEAEYFPIQPDSVVTPVTVFQHPNYLANLDGDVDENVVKSSQVTQTSESKEAADPNRELEIQVDETEHSTQEAGMKQQEDHCNVETVPSSSGGFLCELFSDPKPNTGTWLPGFNRTILHHPESAPVSFEEDEIFL